ncbi:MAG: tRNA (adenosine(37)-N6)-threonylcarbamoyltransferase complex dimerization subunit type 1 TsaB [Trueperaceae bacterium]
MSHGVYLGIDCATPHMSLALVEQDGRVLARAAPDVGREHAARIVGAIDGLLGDAGVTRRDVTAIAVGVGPGSYTGVRVAIATAKGLARALGVPLHGGSTLAAVAAARLAAGERGVAVLDARRGNVYAALVERAHALGESAHALVESAHAPAAGAGLERAPRVRVLDGPLKLATVDLPDRFPGERVLEGAPPDAAALAMTVVDRAGERPQAPEAVYL